MFQNDTPLVEFRGPGGVPVKVTLSMALLGVVLVHVTGGFAEFMRDALVFTLLFLSLYLREVVRAGMIRLLGLRLHGITLSGAGGVCDYARGTPDQEELIAAAGPITSFAIWAIATLILPILPAGGLHTMVEVLAILNLFVGIVTMMPVMPLDGGKLFHLMLRRVIPEPLATRIIGAVGLVLTVIWLPAMLLSFVLFGLALVTIPSADLHWRMLRRAEAA